MTDIRMGLRRRGERGYALLLVFAMASAMAVLLYMEAPRILFQAQRNKEQLLIERGEQYKRAIQVFYRKNKKLPQRVEDLERGTEIRFLRRRYKDPFTGKDDWKFIETDGVNLKNSLIKKPQAALNPANGKGAPADPLTQQQQPAQQAPVTFNAFGQPVQQPCIPGQPCETNQALLRRGSDKPAVAAGGDGQPQGLPACDPAQPLDPTKCDPAKPWDEAAAIALQQQQQQQQQPGFPGQTPYPGQQPYPGQPGYPTAPGTSPTPYPGQPYPGQPYPGQPGVPGQSGYPSIPGFPGGFPGAAPAGRPGGGAFPPIGAPPVSSQTGGGGASPFIPGSSGGAGQNEALKKIGELLTTPRAGGIPGQANAAAMGPGIVGVATKHEGVGIKIYAERTKYQEWEFVYDPKEEKAPNMAGNQQQQGQDANGNPLGRGTGATGSNSPQPGSPSSPFGGGGMGGGIGGTPVGGLGRQR